MRRALAAIIIALAASAAGLGQTKAPDARQELDLGARAYRAGRFAEAEQRFRRALELDPTQKNTPLLIARAVQMQFKPDVNTPENLAAGERAAAAFQEILQNDPRNEDAYKSVLLLYQQMKRDEKVNEWLLWRANDFSAPGEKRAEAFALLASRQWQCSHDITERGENKKTAETPAGAAVSYAMPADAGEFIRARQCVADGLQFVEQAVALDPESRPAWSHKANLLREAAKLAEMEGNAAQKAEYERQYKEAQDASDARRNESDRQKVAQDALVSAGPTAPAETPEPGAKKRMVSGGVLNGKAVTKPAPEYPAEAKAAGAEGTVTVQILIDEEGNVVSAAAVSGHPLLQEAAVRAARAAKFSPTRLMGQPVKVTGVVTYKFVLR